MELRYYSKDVKAFAAEPYSEQRMVHREGRGPLWHASFHSYVSFFTPLP